MDMALNPGEEFPKYAFKDDAVVLQDAFQIRFGGKLASAIFHAANIYQQKWRKISKLVHLLYCGRTMKLALVTAPCLNFQVWLPPFTAWVIFMAAEFHVFDLSACGGQSVPLSTATNSSKLVPTGKVTSKILGAFVNL